MRRFLSFFLFFFFLILFAFPLLFLLLLSLVLLLLLLSLLLFNNFNYLRKRCASSYFPPNSSQVDLSAYAWEDDAVSAATRDDVDVYVELIGGSEGAALNSVRAAIGKFVCVYLRLCE